MKRSWMAVALVAMQLAADPQPVPVASISAGAVHVALPDTILDRADVQKRLGSALTTTFVIVARSRNAAQPPRSRIEIRFDLWDEVYLVRRVEMGKVVDRRRVQSMKDLREWWRTPIHVIDETGSRMTLDLQVLVLPFSAAEEGDARDWLEKSGGVGTDQSSVAGVVGAMIGTTIQARPIATLRWTVEVTE